MAKAEHKTRAKTKADSPNMTVISIKMTTQFRDWLAGLANSERITTVQMIEKAVVDYAERKKYPHTAPRRTEGR